MNRPRLRLIAAFAAIYIIWGSTYLAMRIMAESMPPFFAAGLRHGLAGLLLLAYCAATGRKIPLAVKEWQGPVFLGVLFLAAGNGVATWGVHRIPSGLAALIVATVPFMIALWERFGPQKKALPARLWAGLFFGILGLLWLLEPTLKGGGEFFGVLAMFWAAFCWAWGGLVTRKTRQPADRLVAGGMQMFAGGLVLVLGSVLFGEAAGIRLDQASSRSLWALAYLIIFGSLVAHLSYLWLLQVVEPAMVSTNTFVNPVVAVFLGWWILKEPLTAQTIIASLLVCGSVAVAVTPAWINRPGRFLANLAHQI